MRISLSVMSVAATISVFNILGLVVTSPDFLLTERGSGRIESEQIDRGSGRIMANQSDRGSGRVMADRGSGRIMVYRGSGRISTEHAYRGSGRITA